MADRGIIQLLAVFVPALVLFLSYLMVCRPKTFFEWLIRRRLSWWGVTATLTDEGKFHSMTRVIGILLGVIAVIVGVIASTCTRLAK